MKCSQLLLATLRELPADAEIPSHSLMLRAGLIRKLASGLYSWLPMGMRILHKANAIIREEMNASAAQELIMPLVQPAEIWQQSGRWDASGPELARFYDRHDRPHCLAPTHEEVVTTIANQELTSYRQLPVNLYQIQLKFRDEIRPRFGVMRAREFIMMDGYSFHLDSESLAKTYDEMYDCYTRIFDRIGFEYRVVLADSGSIGGSTSHEFQALAEVGEDVLAISDSGDYAANLELAPCAAPDQPRPAPGRALIKVSTPDAKTIDEVCAFLSVTPAQSLKTLIVRGEEGLFVAVILRGDHSLNLVKAARHPAIATPVEFVEVEELQKHLGVSPGSIGPCSLKMPILVDYSAAVVADFVCGANENGYHFTGANWGRDAQITAIDDFRNITAGEPCPTGKGNVQLVHGVEIGHIFQLGSKYSEAMQATVLDKHGQQITMIMGCYGIGVSRLIAAFIEQNHDDKGIIWSPALAPFQIILIPLNYKSDAVQQASDTLYQELTEAGVDVLLDDRDERAGVKFADSELIGIPYSVIIGEKGLRQGQCELRQRQNGEVTHLALTAAQEHIIDILVA